MLLVLATMLAITVLYFRDLRLPVIAGFWAAWTAGFAVALLPFQGAGLVAMVWQVLVAVTFAIRAKAASA